VELPFVYVNVFRVYARAWLLMYRPIGNQLMLQDELSTGC